VGESNWAALLEVLPLSGMARTVAAHSLPARVEGTTLHLVLREERAMLQVAATEDRIGSALSEHFRCTVGVRILHGRPPSETPADRDARRATARQQAAENSIEGDANVRLLLDAFGGRLLRDTIRPADGRQIGEEETI
jgi:DNA polymerase-3 subunit gamma/tau